MKHLRTLTLVLLAGGIATAQGRDIRKEIEQKMDEIAKLMRQSEELLLEITNVDRLVAQQEDVVRKLKELEPPPRPATPAANAERQKKRRALEEEQSEVVRKLQNMFDRQKQSGEMTVEQLAKISSTSSGRRATDFHSLLLEPRDRLLAQVALQQQ